MICLKCDSLYHIDESLVSHGGEARSKLCAFVKHPNHFRQRCGQVLMREVKSVFEKKMFYPLRTIKESLITLLLSPGLETGCKKWRPQNHSEDNIAPSKQDGVANSEIVYSNM